MSCQSRNVTGYLFDKEKLRFADNKEDGNLISETTTKDIANLEQRLYDNCFG